MEEAKAYTQVDFGSTEEIAAQYLPLVKKIGLHLAARVPDSVELDDLLQVGVIGLIQASNSYDASRGASFATYAGIRIKGAMLDELRRGDWMPRSLQKNLKKIGATITELEAHLGRNVTDTEVAEALGLTNAEYREQSRELSYCRLTSFDESAVELDSSEPELLTKIVEIDQRERLVEAMKALPQREALMMSLYYVDELNLKEIGSVMGVSESRVSQIHGQALARLKAMVSGLD